MLYHGKLLHAELLDDIVAAGLFGKSSKNTPMSRHITMVTAMTAAVM